MKKLKNLMLYLAQKCEADSQFGATKLNKLLFLIDFNAYGLQGTPATEAVYVHLPQGPAPRQLLPAQQSLIEAGDAILRVYNPFPGYTQKQLLALRDPDMSEFNEKELALIDLVIEHHAHYNGSQLSNITHEWLPWVNTREGEEIPYYTVFVMKKQPVTMDAREWGLRRIKEMGIA